MSAPDPLANPSRRPAAVALGEPESWVSIVKWGAIAGVGYFLFANLMNLLVNALTGNTGNVRDSLVYALPYCGSIFAFFFGLYTAGYKAAQERTHVAPGVLSVVVMLVLTQVLQLVITRTTNFTAGSSLGVALVGLLLYVALVLGIGYMGAFYGVKNKLKASATPVR